jgi:hypothetical protein
LHCVGRVARDFVIGSLAQVVPPTEDAAPATVQGDAARLAARHLRRGLCDLSGLILDTLRHLRGCKSPAQRALLLVRLFPELPCDARGQLALALATRLRPEELNQISRAGLLALKDAAALVEPEWVATLEDLVAPALALRPAPTVEGGVLLCADGVSAAIRARAAFFLKGRAASAGARVIHIASAADSAMSAEEAADLLAAEARLSDDATLAHFAAMAVVGRLDVLPEATLRPAPSRWQRAWAALVKSAKVQWYGEEPPPARRPAWSVVTP